MDSNLSIKVKEKAQRNKLRRMKFISTGLLVFIAALYFILKKYKVDQSDNLLYTSFVAFTEAAIIGALADWFAVVALFKHPLGFSWIPHTAIIKKNKNEIGDSLSNFVVDNFFTDKKIIEELAKVQFSIGVKTYLNTQKGNFSRQIVQEIPQFAEKISNSDYLRELTKDQVDGFIKDQVKLAPIAGSLLDSVALSTENQAKSVKMILEFIQKGLNENQNKILDFIMQQKVLPFFTIPRSMAQNIHTQIIDLIQNEIDSINSGNINGGLRKGILDKIQNFAYDLKNTDDVIEKGEAIKNQILGSSAYSNFLNNTLWEFINNNIIDRIILNCKNNPKAMEKIVESAIDELIIKGIFESEENCKQLDEMAKTAITNFVSSDKSHIGRLISDTVKEWPEDDVAYKLELQVGSDLQYIRINGTIVGGFIGMILHIATHFIF